MTRISIAMATYNGAAFLDEQLRTLAAQTLPPFELVVADDGSTDDTLTIVRAFALAAAFPVVILPGDLRLGYRRNFRRATAACSGELIAFCDQDDRWDADKLEVMARCFRDPEVQLAYHNATAFDETGTRLLHSAAEERAALEVRPFPLLKNVNGLLQVFRADLRRFDAEWDRSIDQNVGDDILAHDQWYFFLALLLGKVVFVDRSLLGYRQHGGNLCGAKTDHGLLSRLAERFRHSGTYDVWAARGAESRAAIVDRIAAVEPIPARDEIVRAYRQLADRKLRRAATYLSSNPVTRAAALAGSIAHGDYGRGAWAFPAQSLVRDIWRGVLSGAGSRSATDRA